MLDFPAVYVVSCDP